jgi:5-methylcytosine-specific restriction endonuclease McrA
MEYRLSGGYMKVIDYLKAKYGLQRPTTMLYAEAQAFNIKYPLSKGWMWTHGEKEITGEMASKLRALLSKQIEKNHPRSDSALAGLRVLDNAHIELKNIPDAKSKDFLYSKAWLRLRLSALKEHGNKCQSCGQSPDDGIKLNVDHIKPRRLFPELALDITNLQVLCSQCNEGKGNWDMTDFRKEETNGRL